MQTSPGLASAAEPLRGSRNGNGKPARSLKPLLLFVVAALIIAAGVYPQLPARQKKPQKVLWFMAIASDEKVQPCRAMSDCPRAVQRAENMFDEYALYGKVALLSAKKYAPSVVPIMLYPGNYNAYMKWFEQEGGLAFHHRTSLLPRWQGAVAAGNVSETIYMAESLYLRFDIPIIMPDVLEALKAKGFDMSNINTTHVFFTDNDAVWVNDFNTDIIPHTDVVAIGAEATPGTVGNAGILYINVEGAREPFADMYNWAELKWWWRNPYTQHMLLQYFEPTGLVTQLPDAYNYKPYWGNVKGEARCVHFHGPKPDRCLPCYLNVARLNPARIDECNCTHYDKLWQMGIDADNGDFFARLQDEFQDFRQMPDTYSDTSLS